MLEEADEEIEIAPSHLRRSWRVRNRPDRYRDNVAELLPYLDELGEEVEASRGGVDGNLCDTLNSVEENAQGISGEVENAQMQGEEWDQQEEPEDVTSGGDRVAGGE